MKRIIARYYHALKKRNADVPYATTIMFVAGSMMFHWFQLGALFDIPDKFYGPVTLKNPTADGWVNAFVMGTPMIIISLLIFRKKDLDKYTFTDSELKRGYRNVVIYGVVSMLFMFALAIRKGIKLGTI